MSLVNIEVPTYCTRHACPTRKLNKNGSLSLSLSLYVCRHIDSPWPWLWPWHKTVLKNPCKKQKNKHIHMYILTGVLGGDGAIGAGVVGIGVGKGVGLCKCVNIVQSFHSRSHCVHSHSHMMEIKHVLIKTYRNDNLTSKGSSYKVDAFLWVWQGECVINEHPSDHWDRILNISNRHIQTTFTHITYWSRYNSCPWCCPAPITEISVFKADVLFIRDDTICLSMFSFNQETQNPLIRLDRWTYCFSLRY